MTPLRFFARVAAILMAATSCASPHSPRRHLVDMRALRFQPESVTVAVGDTITWVNRDIVPHTSTAADSAWRSPVVSAADSFATALTRVGVYRYACAFHPDMVGVIVVR